MGILESISTVFIVIVLLIVGVNLIMTISLYRTSLIEREEEEFDAAKREAMRRKVGVSLVAEKEVVQSVMYLARNRIGTAIIIEGETPLLDIEATGDSFGFGEITTEFLNTLASSHGMSKGAILIRRDHIVAYNCKMPIFKHEALMRQGAGNRHLGAMGTMLEYKDSVILVVSGTTGKISIFGHLNGQSSIDLGLTLKEIDIINGVGEDELTYRLHTLIESTGVSGDLNSEEVQRDMMLKTESKEERKARLQRERADKIAQKNTQKTTRRMDLTEQNQEDEEPVKKGKKKRPAGKQAPKKKKSTHTQEPDGGGLTNAISGLFKK